MTQSNNSGLEKILSVFSINLRRAYNNVEGFNINEVHESAIAAINQSFISHEKVLEALKPEEVPDGTAKWTSGVIERNQLKSELIKELGLK